MIRCQREQAVKPAELAGTPGKDWESGRAACSARPLRIIDSPQQRLTLHAVATANDRLTGIVQNLRKHCLPTGGVSRWTRPKSRVNFADASFT
jgi:hypothetical protein